MAKGAQIKKLVNGEIADADDVNQIVENAGSEGGLIPYDQTSQEKSVDGSQSLGAVATPWGSLKVNQNAELVEVDAVGHTAAAAIAFKNLRRFLTLKDCPSSFSGQGGKVLRVNTDEDAVEFLSLSNFQIFTANGSFNVPSGIDYVYLTIVGGGGGALVAAKGGGGGGGGYVENFSYYVNGKTTCAVVVGAGGAAGRAGSASTFDSSVSVPGGSAGRLPSGGAGGGIGLDASGITVGSYVRKGGAGGSGVGDNGGAGGGTPFGVGGAAGILGNVNGHAASANSGGGGGAGYAGGSGAAGGSGLVLVMW